MTDGPWQVATQGGGTILWNRVTGERRRVYSNRAEAQAAADDLNDDEDEALAESLMVINDEMEGF